MKIKLEETYSKKQLERFLRNSERRAYLAGTLAVLAFLGGTLVAVSVLLYQIDIWRETGTWESLPVSEVLLRIARRLFQVAQQRVFLGMGQESYNCNRPVPAFLILVAALSARSMDICYHCPCRTVHCGKLAKKTREIGRGFRRRP